MKKHIQYIDIYHIFMVEPGGIESSA